MFGSASSFGRAESSKTLTTTEVVVEDSLKIINQAIQLAPEGTDPGKLRALLTSNLFDKIFHLTLGCNAAPSSPLKNDINAEEKSPEGVIHYLTLIRKDLCKWLVSNSFSRTNIIADLLQSEIIYDIFLHCMEEKKAAMDLLSYIVKMNSVVAKTHTKSVFSTALKDLSRHFQSKLNQQSTLSADDDQCSVLLDMMDKHFLYLQEQEVPDAILSFNPRWADLMAAAWTREVHWEQAQICQIAYTLRTLLNGKECLGLNFLSQGRPEECLVKRNILAQRDPECQETKEWQLNCQNLHALLALHPKSDFKDTTRHLNSKFPLTNAAQFLLSLSANQLAEMQHALKAGALMTISTSLKQRQLWLSKGLLPFYKSSVLSLKAEVAGHDLLNNLLEGFEIRGDYGDLLALHCAVFEGASQDTLDSFWLVDANVPARAALLDKIIGEFPHSTACLASYLSALIDNVSGSGVSFVLDLLAHSR